MRCASEASTSSTAAAAGGVAGEGGVCGEAEVDQEDFSAFCSSLELLDSPYTCEEVRSAIWAVAKAGCVQQQGCMLYVLSDVKQLRIALELLLGIRRISTGLAVAQRSWCTSISNTMPGGILRSVPGTD